MKYKNTLIAYVIASNAAEYILNVDGEIDLRDSAIISEIMVDYGDDKLVQLEFSNDEIVYRINTDVDHSTENEKFITALQDMEGVVTSVTIDLIQATLTTNPEYFTMLAKTNTNASAEETASSDVKQATQKAPAVDAPKAEKAPETNSAAQSTAQPTEDESIFTWKNAATAAKYVAGAVIVAGAVYLAVNHFSTGGNTGADTLE